MPKGATRVALLTESDMDAGPLHAIAEITEVNGNSVSLQVRIVPTGTARTISVTNEDGTFKRLHQIRREYAELVADALGGNCLATADALGINRNTLPKLLPRGYFSRGRKPQQTKRPP